ncbi:MAG: hypothetical protein ACPF9K_14890 [Neptuniibacter sp.]
MENEYRPFFSRKQLNVLMWFSLLAILVLSSLGPGEVEYQTIEHNKEKSVYWMELDDQLNTLTLLLPSQPALNRSQQQLQQLKAQILLSRLKQLNNSAYTYNVYPRQDRIELSLNWAADQETPDINPLLSALNQPVEANRWQDVLKTLQARDYLNAKATEEHAVEAFFTRFQPPLNEVLPILSSSYSALFNNVKFVVSGDNAEQISEQIIESLPEETQSQLSSSITPIAANINQQAESSDAFIFLTGETIPPRADPQFTAQRVTAQVLQDLLESQQQALNYKYRLLWGSLQSTGYRAVIITANQSPEAILPQLQQLINEDLVETSQKRLAGQWQERMRDLQNQVQAMNLIAYYDLPITTMEDYVEQIQDIDEEEIVALARKALDTDLHINIMLSPKY